MACIPATSQNQTSPKRSSRAFFLFQCQCCHLLLLLAAVMMLLKTAAAKKTMTWLMASAAASSGVPCGRKTDELRPATTLQKEKASNQDWAQTTTEWTEKTPQAEATRATSQQS
jgi:hypothetical protein